MTRPQMLLANSVYMVTRRVTQRQFLLLPSGEINACMRYVFALAAAETGVTLHGICVLSNHYHAIVGDPDGRVPEFACRVNSLLARAINTYRGRWEGLWASGTGPSYVRLEDGDAVMRAAVYIAMNPVAGGLVSHGDTWSGVRHVLPGSITAHKPGFFFRSASGESQPRKKRRGKQSWWEEQLKRRSTNDPLPDKVALRIKPLPIVGNKAEIQRLLLARIAAEEKNVRAEFRRTGRKFLGITGLKKQSPFDSPQSHAPRRGLSPRVATRDKWKRIAALQRSKEFDEQHREARIRWCAGDRDVVFPAGTYAMRVRHNVNCAEP